MAKFECPYCYRKKPIMLSQNLELRLISDTYLYAWLKGKPDVSQDINFCPICGRRLYHASKHSLQRTLIEKAQHFIAKMNQ